MWNPQSPSPAERRDRGLGRVRAWTTAGVLFAGTLVALFAVVVAGQFPGHDTAASSGTSAAPQPAPASDDSGDGGGVIQPPPSGFFGSGSGGSSTGRHAVSGGS
jgi:hypothetical protein